MGPVLMTLVEACERYLPGARPDTLKAEHNRGRLPFHKIGKRFYVKPADMEAMIEQCRVEGKKPDSGLIRSASNGLSKTARSKSAQDALEMIVGKPNSSSPRTSPLNTALRNQVGKLRGF